MNKPELVKVLVLDAPLVLDWLMRLGVMFDREKDGTLICSLGGGQSRKRIHSAKDYSRLERTVGPQGGRWAAAGCPPASCYWRIDTTCRIGPAAPLDTTTLASQSASSCLGKSER